MTSISDSTRREIDVVCARDILGDLAGDMSDDEVQQLIDDLSVLAKWALDEARVQNKKVGR